MWADLNLCWVHMIESTCTDVAAHKYMLSFLDIIFGESDSDISFASSDNTDKLMREIFIAAEALQNQGMNVQTAYVPRSTLTL